MVSFVRAAVRVPDRSSLFSVVRTSLIGSGRFLVVGEAIIQRPASGFHLATVLVANCLVAGAGLPRAVRVVAKQVAAFPAD